MVDEDDSADAGEQTLVQVSHMVPERHRDRATENTDHGGVSEMVREAYRLLAEGYATDEARLRLQLNRAVRESEAIEAHIDDLESELDNLSDRRSELRDRLDAIDSREDVFESVMTTLDESLAMGDSVFPEHGKVQRAASYSEYTPSEIVERLKERNPEALSSQFTKGAVDTSRRDERGR